jgi:hypothetical protein
MVNNVLYQLGNYLSRPYCLKPFQFLQEVMRETRDFLGRAPTRHERRSKVYRCFHLP